MRRRNYLTGAGEANIAKKWVVEIVAEEINNLAQNIFVDIYDQRILTSEDGASQSC